MQREVVFACRGLAGTQLDGRVPQPSPLHDSQAVNAVCTQVEGLWEEACTVTLHAALALAHGSRVVDVNEQLAARYGQDGQATGPSDVVRWVSSIWTGRAHAAAGTAAACLQNLSWETAVPEISGAAPDAGGCNDGGLHPTRDAALAHKLCMSRCTLQLLRGKGRMPLKRGHVIGKARLRTALGMMAVARSIAAGAAEGGDQGYLLWLWALLSSDAGHTLTHLDDQVAEEEAHVVCMTEARTSHRAMKRDLLWLTLEAIKTTNGNMFGARAARQDFNTLGTNFDHQRPFATGTGVHGAVCDFMGGTAA